MPNDRCERGSWMGRVALIMLVTARIARADEPLPTVSSTETRPTREPAPAPQECPVPNECPIQDHTAGDVEGAPAPGNESGRIDRVDPGDSSFRVLARGALFVPKIAYEVVLSPIRGSLYLDDRYALVDRYYNLFWNRDRTIGLYPTATYATGYSPAVGVHFIAKDLLGEGEQLSATAAVGFEAYRVSGRLRFRSGRRFGSHLELGFDGNFDRLPRNPFYGIGNSGDEAQLPLVVPIDPLVDPTAVHTYHRYQELRGSAMADVRVFDSVHLIGRTEFTELKTTPSTKDPSIQEIYNPMDLIGFDQSVTHFYGELEARWDTRRSASVWEPRDIYSEGSLVTGFAGPVIPITSGYDHFWHYGVELQQFVRLASAPRFLVFRFHGEGVTGALDQVPFVELPYLGGDAFLRGYPYQRFRDRVAAVASAQYGWDLSGLVGAYVFCDVGRVYSSLDDLTLDGLHVGYGVGISIQDTNGAFLLEGTLGSSSDGGVVATVSFSPVLDARTRWR